MTIDKQALREEFRYMQDHYSDPADRERQEIYIAAEAALDELDVKEEQRANWFQMAQKLGEDLDAAERRVAELDQRLIEYAGIATREARRVAELEDENEYVRWRFKESDLLFAMLLITMRAAVIEKEHGEGDRAAMDWIINKLAGPGEFAPESETDAQAYFNRESEIIDSEFSACMDFFMKRNERLRAAGIKVKGE